MKKLPVIPHHHFHSGGEAYKNSFIFVLTLIVAALPDMARAQAIGEMGSNVQSLGDMMCAVSQNIAPFENLINGFAYITGAILIGIGLSQLAYFTDTFSASKQYGISKPKGLLISGSALLSFPYFLNVLTHTLFRNADNGNGIHVCQPLVIIGAGGTAGNVGLDGLMINLVMNIKGPMVSMLSVLCVLMGMMMVCRGLLKGSKFGQDAKSTVPNIIANLTIGTILFTIGTSLNEIMTTVFGDDNVWGSGIVTSAIRSDFGANTQPFQSAVYAALTFFQLVGFIAFIRGWLIIRDAVEGQGQKTVAQGLTHIFGGVLAVNIYRFLDVMDTTFGTGFL